METNSSVLFGKFSSSSGKYKKGKLWAELVGEMNKLGPPSKSVTNWKNVIVQSSAITTVFRVITLFVGFFFLVLEQTQI